MLSFKYVRAAGLDATSLLCFTNVLQVGEYVFYFSLVLSGKTCTRFPCRILLFVMHFFPTFGQQ